MQVTVYATKASALNMKHPHGHPMKLDGVMWPKDAFTGRRLRDGSVTTEAAKAYVPAPGQGTAHSRVETPAED